MSLDIRTATGYALTTLVAYGLYRVGTWMAHPSSIRVLPGPPSPHWFFGEFKHLNAADRTDEVFTILEKWAAEHGPTYVFKGLFARDRLMTFDVKAISHVLMHSDLYWKPNALRIELGRLLGESVLITEGEQHRMQRKLMNPAFGPGQVRELSGIFLDKANELREKWTSLVDPSSDAPRIDVFKGLSAATLDIIGLAGFNYSFDALSRPDDDPNELSAAFDAIFDGKDEVTVWAVLCHFVPILLKVPTKGNRKVWHSRAVMDRVGLQLVREKKAAVANEGSDSLKNSRDLLSLLIRANMSEDPSQRLSDYDVMAQIPTFIIAGHETTANALTWAIFALCQRPDIQDRLREELRSLPLSTTVNDNAAFTQEDLAALDKLPLLDAVVRETLRVHAPVPSTSRVAMQDDEIPVSHPYTDRNGILRNSIPMEKGTEFPVLILAVNRSKDIWGPDALEWSPDRWLQGVPEGVKSIPGVWGPLLTFINGSHACIGFRFALIEMKVILHAIASEFHFKLGTDPSDVIKRSTGLVYRPFLKSEKEKGVQLPVLVSRVPRD